jgi:hypothetical protein
MTTVVSSFLVVSGWETIISDWCWGSMVAKKVAVERMQLVAAVALLLEPTRCFSWGVLMAWWGE